MALPAAYYIDLPEFEGPFDLLLFFIERDELDVRDIPIAKLTDDYLEYVRHAETLDIALAGEFIVVAATLMSIKARVLLPRPEVSETGEVVDPRGELVDRLLEYKRYRAAVPDLRTLEAERAERFARDFDPKQFVELADAAVEASAWESVSLFKLAKAFERVMKRKALRRDRPVHRVVRWPFTIKQESARVVSLVEFRGRVSFVELFEACENRVHAVVTFLALLELLNAARVTLKQRPGINTFWLRAGGTQDSQDESNSLSLGESAPAFSSAS